MKVASVAEVGADFAGFLRESKRGPVVVMQRGKPVAVLLGTANSKDLERLLMDHSPELQATLEAARRRFRAGEGIPHDAFWKEVEAEQAGPTRKRNGPRGNGRTKP